MVRAWAADFFPVLACKYCTAWIWLNSYSCFLWKDGYRNHRWWWLELGTSNNETKIVCIPWPAECSWDLHQPEFREQILHPLAKQTCLLLAKNVKDKDIFCLSIDMIYVRSSGEIWEGDITLDHIWEVKFQSILCLLGDGSNLPNQGNAQKPPPARLR